MTPLSARVRLAVSPLTFSVADLTASRTTENHTKVAANSQHHSEIAGTLGFKSFGFIHSNLSLSNLLYLCLQFHISLSLIFAYSAFVYIAIN